MLGRDRMRLTDYEVKVCEGILASHPPGKHAARSAVRHLLMAWKLRRIDPEMAAFHALTAEEEAATAIFRSVRRLQYGNSERLNPRNHLHKNAIIPFFMAVAKIFALATKEGFASKLELDEKQSPPRFGVLVGVPDGKSKKWGRPIPPLDFTVSRNGQLHDYLEQMRDIASAQNVKSVQKLLEDRANLRNQILYASGNGIPNIVGVGKLIQARRLWVFRNLLVYLLIDQTPRTQGFVQQGLDAFLGLVGKLP